MKKITSILPLLLCFIILTSCGSYRTYSAGKADQSYVLILTEDSVYRNIIVSINDVEHKIEKVYTVNKARKAKPIIISTGKSTLKIISDGNVIHKENIFLSTQQTKKIILQ